MTEDLTAIVVIGAIVIFSTDIAVAVVAGKKGRPVLPWFFAAFFFTPIIALLMLIAVGDSDLGNEVGPRESAAERRRARRAGD